MADCGSLNTMTLRGAFLGNFMAHYDAARNRCQPTSRAFMCQRSLLQVTRETLAVANPDEPLLVGPLCLSRGLPPCLMPFQPALRESRIRLLSGPPASSRSIYGKR